MRKVLFSFFLLSWASFIQAERNCKIVSVDDNITIISFDLEKLNFDYPLPFVVKTGRKYVGMSLMFEKAYDTTLRVYTTINLSDYEDYKGSTLVSLFNPNKAEPLFFQSASKNALDKYETRELALHCNK